MLKANTLFVVVVVALIIGILSSNLILVAYINKLQIHRNVLQNNFHSNINSAVSILLSDSNSFDLRNGKGFDLYGESKDSVLIQKRTWGVFELGIIRAFGGGNEIKKVVLVGRKSDDITSASIYLKDTGKKLIVLGNSSINGNCYLPDAGIAKGLDGRTFYDENLVSGQIKVSTTNLPRINDGFKNEIADFFNRNFLNQNYISSSFDFDTLNASFHNTTVLLYAPGSIDLRNKKISGNVIVVSGKKIIADSSSSLSDVLLFAPIVVVGQKFTGRLQIFATDSLVIGKNSLLKYPSAVTIYKGDSDISQPLLMVEENAEIRGILLSLRKEIVDDFQQTLISVEKKAKICGQIYADGNVDLKGVVWGNVICNLFFSQASGHVNHLFDVTIDNSKLYPLFVGSSIIETSGKKGVAACLE